VKCGIYIVRYEVLLVAKAGSEISGVYEAKAVDDTRLSEVLSFDIHESEWRRKGGGNSQVLKDEYRLIKAFSESLV
jgi:hypothetical protein